MDYGVATSVIVELEGKLSRLRCEVTELQEVLHAKNLQLDALHYVWCSGGCDGGMHRWTKGS